MAGAALSALMGAIVQLHALEELVDRPVALFFASQRDTMFVQVAWFLTDFGKAYWFIIPAAVAFVLSRFVLRNPLYASQALFVLLSVAVTGIVVDIIKIVFGRARPNLLLNHDIYQFFFFRFGRDYNSFPSGHTACAMAAGVALALIFPKYRSLALAGGITLACTRFVTTAHYISDVVASSMIAVVGVLTIRVILARYGFPLSWGGAAATSPRHGLVAKTIGVPVDAPDTHTAPPRLIAPSVFGVVIAAVAMSTSGLLPNLALIEWQERSSPNFEPMVEGWLWLSLFVSVGFGALTWIFQRRVSLPQSRSSN
ncbi:phosphatase PAP2 family protein [Chelativorans salis]|uniref:Phosphatase PAP2 family protein n=1 Tax=Chelativorans salis TaxID=2978478 RepID=A0ABT2LU80_9HYPH|nr:phosphatase PAP2 family protein [Chelativorans sp. EGI FJ00035]MCT7378090.1 phosphatase PAP2 family protein [Chelativorans sp. EGI FJ00035]